MTSSKTLNALAQVAEDHAKRVTGMTDADRVKAAILASLDELGGLSVAESDLIFEGDKMILPATFDGRIEDAISYLEDWKEGQTAKYNFSRTFPFRPWDGAHAFQAALMKHFGNTGIGKVTQTFFGSYPPEYRTISTGVNTQTQVPWGEVNFAPLEATFQIGGTRDREKGTVFALSVTAPKKYRKHIDAFFTLVEEELKTNSIYKGKAITGGEEPIFQDVFRTDPKKVIFSQLVQEQLRANVWSLLEHSERMRSLGIPLKRAVLVEGPYGTGKTLAGALTGQIAVNNGWTYILCRTGVDKLEDVLQTAQIYAPAVVWFEDIDTLATDGTALEISKVLDMLDGVSSKGVEVLAGFTTNFIEKIQKGVLRPGRIDAIIHVAELDAQGFQDLIKALVPADVLAEDIEFSTVAEAFVGFLPAFAAEAISRAMRYTIARTGGDDMTITTSDLVQAAEGLRPQLEIMNEAAEGSRVATLDSVLLNHLTNVVNHTVHGSQHGQDRQMLRLDLDVAEKDSFYIS